MSFFGKTIGETKDAFLGASSTSDKAKKDPEILKKEAVARITISIILIIGAFSLIFTNTSPDIGKIVLGAITGYWLR